MKHSAKTKALVIARIAAREKIKRPSWDKPKRGPLDRRQHKAEGGIVWDAPPAVDASKIKWDTSEPKLSDAVTDIPSEVGHAASENLDAIKKAFLPSGQGSQGPFERLANTGKGLLAIPGLVASPITGAARSLIGHPMAQAEHAVGTVIAPEIAAKDDPQKMYDKAKGDTDLALSAMRPAGLPVKAPAPTATQRAKYEIPANKPAYEWQQPAPASANPPAPSTKELFEAADNNYKNARGLGVEIHPQAVKDVADNIFTELHTEGYRDYLAPKTYRAVEELKNPPGQNVEIADIEGARRALNKASADPAERDAARRAINAIDGYVSGLNPADVVVNPQFAGRVAAEAQEARGNYAAAKRSELLEAGEKKAQRQADSAGSGTNIDNATRQKIKEILNNPKKLRGFTAMEIEQMELINKGTPTGNVARLLGKFAPSGVVSGALSAGAGFAAHGPLGAVVVPAMGYAAKKAADASTLRLLAKLKDQVRARSPLGKQNAINAAAQSVQPSSPLMLPGGMFTASQIQSPFSMRQLQGPVPARANDE